MSKSLVDQAILYLLSETDIGTNSSGKRFYGYFLSSMRKHYDNKKVETAGISVTNQVNLYVNTDFFKTLSIPQRIEVLEHECISGENLIETEDGPIKMKDIVNKKLNIKVKSLSKNGKIEYKPITEFSKKCLEKFPKKRWVSVKYTDNNRLYKTLVCTNDHRIAVVDNPLEPEIRYTKAENAEGLYSIRKVDINRKNNKEKPLFNQKQIEIIIGCLLGDSSITKEGALIHIGSKKHKEYTLFKNEILGGKVVEAYSGYTKKKSNLRVNNGINEQSKYLRNIMYINGKKSVKNIIKYITPLSLAFWYMDDGSNNGYNNTFFHTEGFSKEDQMLLIKMLYNKFGIVAELMPRSHKKHLTCIKLKKKATEILFRTILPYLHPSMIHKVHKNFKNMVSIPEINNKPLSYSIKKITKVIDRPSTNSYLYDIGVKDNSNFFANNTLVHNCKHLISNHHGRYKKLDDKDQKLWNIACDAAINEPLKHLHEMGVTVDKLKETIKDLEKGETPEYYYKALKKYRDENGGKEGKGQKELEDRYGESGSEGKVLDDHTKWSEESQNGEGENNSKELQNEILKKSLKDAVEKSGGRGNVPMDIIKALDELNPATINWKQQLKRFFERADKFSKEPTRKKLNRRYRHLNPGRRKKPMTHIAIAIDESGSVSDSLHKQFFSEIEAASKIEQIKFTIIHADCTINRVYEYKSGMKVERTGMGGTAYMPAINKAKELKVDGMIYFGDGDIFGEVLDKPSFPFLWAMEEGRDAPVSWGRVCHVKYEETYGNF